MKELVDEALNLVSPAFAMPKDGLFFMEEIPSRIRDIVVEPAELVAKVASSVNNSGGCETLHDAAIMAKAVGLSLLENVMPENLFLVFGQARELPLYSSTFGEGCPCVGQDENAQIGKAKDQARSKNKAVIFCHVKDADLIECGIGEKYSNRATGDNYKVMTWFEFEQLLKTF